MELVQKQVLIVNRTYKKQQKIINLERQLTTDLNTHKAFIKVQGKELQLKNSKDTVNYQITEKYIVREKDTIDLQSGFPIFYLDGIQVSSGIIDAVEFSFTDTYSKQAFFVYKRKDASHYINEYGL